MRRVTYRDLVLASYGRWDEERHNRHAEKCWLDAEIDLVVVETVAVGMIQIFDRVDEIEISEIQIHPTHQNCGIGIQVVRDVVVSAQRKRKAVVLSVPLQNADAKRLYVRLGFRSVGHNHSHEHLRLDRHDS